MVESYEIPSLVVKGTDFRTTVGGGLRVFIIKNPIVQFISDKKSLTSWLPLILTV